MTQWKPVSASKLRNLIPLFLWIPFAYLLPGAIGNTLDPEARESVVFWLGAAWTWTLIFAWKE